MKIKFPLFLLLVMTVVIFTSAARSTSASNTDVSCDSDRAYFSQDLILVSSPTTADLYRATGSGWVTITTPITWTQLRATPDKTIFVYNDSNGSFYGSTDLGATWSISGTFPMASPYIATRFYPAPISDTLFVGVNDYSIQISGNRAIYKSTDNGGQWNNTGGGAGTFIAFSPDFADDRTAFESFAVYHGSGVSKSTDGGDSWSVASNGLQSLQGIPFELAISPNYTHDQVVFAVGYTGYYKTTDAGATWAYLRSGKHVALSPNYAVDRTALLINSNSKLEISQDGAATWQSISLPISATAQVAALWVIVPFEPPTPQPPPAAPHHVYLPIVNAARIQPLEIWLIANDGVGCKLYRSSNFGMTWQEEMIVKKQ